MYTTHRIPGSPSSPAARRASEFGGGSENRWKSPVVGGKRRFQRERALPMQCSLLMVVECDFVLLEPAHERRAATDPIVGFHPPG